MLFFIFLIAAIGTLILYKISDESLGLLTLTVFCWIITAIMLLVILISNSNVDGQIAQEQQRYESLVYQAENNLYDNDNDFGKKELMDEICDWNKDLVFYKEVQRNFWYGIFYPNIYDNFELIPYDIIT